MSFWFTEHHTASRGLSFLINKVLYQEKSVYQEMKIVETDDFGKVMLLDDVVMVTEEDEFVYHEMLTHVALFSHPNPQDILIIGGGDGGALREVCRHARVKTATLVEIDDMVVRGARQYFPVFKEGLDNPKAKILIEDGIRFLQETEVKYDVILIDSTDPVGPATGLFQIDFYQSCKRALKENGIIVAQAESPYIHTLQDVTRAMVRDMKSMFSEVHLYLASIQTYQAGLWSFLFASDTINPRARFQQQAYQEYVLPLRYYNEEIHQACFALPTFVKKIVQ